MTALFGPRATHVVRSTDGADALDHRGDGLCGGLIPPPSEEGFETNAVVFEHVPVAELPAAWRAKLARAGDALVTVRIEVEAQAAPAEEFATDDPAFGIWRDREDMADVAAYVRKIRQPRYNRDGSRNER